jgi:hypothetical protein
MDPRCFDFMKESNFSPTFFFLYVSIALWTLAVFQLLNPVHSR